MIKWLVERRLAWFELYPEEVRLRLKMIEEISRRVHGRVVDVGSALVFPPVGLRSTQKNCISSGGFPRAVKFSRQGSFPQ